MKALGQIIHFYHKQGTFIKIGFLFGAASITFLAGYFVGGFIGRMTG